MKLRSPADAGAWLSTLKGLGARSLGLQALHRARLRSGWYERVLPVSEWTDLPEAVVASSRAVFAAPERSKIHSHTTEKAAALEAGRRVAQGECLYFFSRWLERPADWRRNPITNHDTPLDHGSTLPPFNGPEQGDVKWIWEASRFDWVYLLGRAWAAAEEEDEAESFVETFWTQLADWRSANPPNHGINWRCGQECSFRLIALVWAAGVFGKATATTPARRAELWSTVAALAGRIDRAMAHALSQNNNHGLSEAAALHLAGTALPGHPLAGQWCNKGHKHFVREVAAQFLPDGSYSQHSTNYMRVALRDVFVFIRAVQIDGDELPPLVRDRAVAACALLHQLQDPESGRVPNYGANDGANIFHLSGCDYGDYRPVLQLLSSELDNRRIYPGGPWDEELAWHGWEETLDAELQPRRRRSFGREAGGYFCIRGERSFGLVRCHSFTNRPGDADMLHLDLWVDGVNVLPDRGSYSYNDPQAWGRFLRSTAAHNTVTVDGLDQMRRGSRFLWLDWTQARCRAFGSHRIEGWDGWLFDGEHYGYGQEQQGVLHRRQVLHRADRWLVIDDLTLLDGQSHELSLRWLLGGEGDWVSEARAYRRTDPDLTLEVFGPGESALCEGRDHLPANGVSSTYGEIEPYPLLVHSHTTDRSLRWVTSIGPACQEAEGQLRWEDLTIPLAWNQECL
ncbi:MAG: alginate lyase family protein [Myxococcota bacterium]|nr:alginate lyase family protein [Myxococcota bacterium]